MNTEDLINQLSTDLKPVKLQSSPVRFTTQFFLFSLFIVGSGLLILKVRPDLNTQLADHLFLIEIFFTLSLMISGYLLISWLTSPGRTHGSLYKFGTSITFFTLLILNSYRLSLNSIPFYRVPVLKSDLLCFIIVLTYSLISSAILFIIVKKRVITAPGLVGAMIGVTSTASGILAISMHCKNLGLVHVSVYHFLFPAAVSLLLGFIGGKFALRW